MIRKKHFQQIVLDNFLQGIKPFPILNISRLKKSDYYEMAIKCYEELGGRQACPFISMPAWDVVIEKERKLIALQLDEAIHFNRYRLKTLRNTLYQAIEGFQPLKYVSYCQQYESECLKSATAGNLWTNPIAEKEFGESEKPAQLFGNGAAAWKLRAFTDFLQDLTTFVLPITVLRIAVWDELLLAGKLHKIGDILLNPTENQAKAFLQYLNRRIDAIV